MRSVGKKAVNRLGCYGCHDIPGFENVKSIGVGLNDWGKKPADRLAFEDIGNFFKEHYYPVPSLRDKFGTPVHGIKEEHGKKLEPYEKFYKDVLLGHNPERMGYLNQKLRDPRSYDYNRTRTWDDRSRMPKFTFARPRKHKDEENDDFQKRIFAEEAEAREAVATFILGLTAGSGKDDQQQHDCGPPRRGRAAVLDRYNCRCHMIPGAYDFKVGDDTLKNLDRARVESELMKDRRDRRPQFHQLGRPQSGWRPLTTSRVAAPQQREAEAVSMMPAEALRLTDARANIPRASVSSSRRTICCLPGPHDRIGRGI